MEEVDSAVGITDSSTGVVTTTLVVVAVASKEVKIAIQALVALPSNMGVDILCLPTSLTSSSPGAPLCSSNTATRIGLTVKRE